MEREKPLYLTDREVSRQFNIGLQTLRNDRARGRGLPYIKFTPGPRGKVLYAYEDIIHYMEERKIMPERS